MAKKVAFLNVVVFMILISPMCVAELATSFRNPIDSYSVGCNHYWGTCFRSGYWHLAEDAMAPANTPVYACANGVVKDNTEHQLYGYVVIIEHTLPSGEKVCSVNGHLDSRVTVSLEQPVRKGDILGYLGTSLENGGYEPHIHFGLRKGSFSLNGYNYSRCSHSGTEWGYSGYTDCESQYNNWYAPTDFINSHLADNSIYTYTNNGYTAYGPVVGGSATNWEYSASPRAEIFNLGETVYAVMKVENVKARHRYRVIVYYNNNGTWTEQWRSDTAYNEASPTSPWDKSFFFPGVYLDKAGRWGIDAYIDIGSGFVLLDNFGVTVNAPAPYLYTNNAYLCTGPVLNRGNWVYSGTKQKTSFVKGGSVYAVAKIENISANHFFHVDFYVNGIKQGTGWDTGWNNVTGVWDKAYFFPGWYNVPAGNCEMKLYVNFGQGNILLQSLPFSVSNSSTPYYTYYSTDMAGNATAFMCKSVTGGSSTDWVYTGHNKATTFKKTDVPTALFMITDVKRTHRFLVEAYWRSSTSSAWNFRWNWWVDNSVSSSSPWKWSYFWPTWTNPPVGYCKFDIYVECNGVMTKHKTLTFTVTN